MSYSIGDLARHTGYAVQTIRYYEEIGLLPSPQRSAGGQRRYDADGLGRLQFIRRARDLGFSVEDVRHLLNLANDPQRSCGSVDQIAETHLAAIDAKITALRAMRRDISRMLECCDKTRIADCKIINRLTDG